MSRLNTATPAPVAGADIAKVLHGLGEASAAGSPIELFALCLRAQQVLGQVRDSRATSADEAALLAAFRAMGRRPREITLAFVRELALSSPQCAPALALVRPGQSIGEGAK